MPAKLYAVIILLAANIVVNLIDKSFLSAALGGLLIFFMIKASHTARTIGIWLSVIGLGVLAFTVIQGASQIGFSKFPGLAWALIAIGVVSSGFTIWALTRPDVVEWFDNQHGAGATSSGNPDQPRYD